jgi:hypothetical protein
MWRKRSIGLQEAAKLRARRFELVHGIGDGIRFDCDARAAGALTRNAEKFDADAVWFREVHALFIPQKGSIAKSRVRLDSAPMRFHFVPFVIAAKMR